MHKHTVSASSGMYALKFSQLFQKNSLPERAQERNVVGHLLSQRRLWGGGGVWEELFHPSLPVINALNVDCSGKHIFCQLHPLCPASWHSHLGNCSVFGTITCTPTHTSLDGVFTFHWWIRYRIKAFLKHTWKHMYLCTHTRALTAQEAYQNLQNVRISPSTFWQLN